MGALVLQSEKAIDVNVPIMRAFVMLRQFSLSYKDIADKLAKLEKKYNKQFKDVFEALDLLLKDKGWEDRERIGFK